MVGNIKYIEGILRQIIALLLLISAAEMQAQEVVFQASVSNGVVEAGASFRLSFSVNAKADNFVPPDLNAFAVLSGPNMSTSSSVQIINGRMTQSVSYTYNYVLQAVQEGSFTIGPASIDVDKKTYNTDEVPVTVVQGSGQQQKVTPVPPAATTVPGFSAEDLFIRVLVDRKEVFQGEHLVATVKLFSKLDISGIEKINFPSFTGFLQQEIEIPPLRFLNREVVNGQVYSTGMIKQLVLIPQRSGELIIDQVSIDCQIRQRVRRSTGSLFDDFFDSYQTVVQTATSEPQTIRVKPLPSGAPSSFRGLVGSYIMEASVDREKLPANEAVTLKLKITGKGNLRLMDPPPVSFPPDFEVYDPRVTQNISHSVSGSSGAKTFDYLVIPRSAGRYRIPPVEISYFDPAAVRYVRLSSEEFIVDVSRPETEDAGQVISGWGKEQLQLLGKDIRFIRTTNIRWQPAGINLLTRAWFYLMYLLGFVLFAVVFALRIRHVRRNRNLGMVRNRRANKIAVRRLKLAAAALKRNEKDVFYEEVLKACWGYLSDKLNIPLSSLGRDIAIEQLMDRGVEETVISRFFETIDTCELARYAPAGEQDGLPRMYRDVQRQISKLEQILK